MTHCMRFIESEIERLSQPEENGKEAPLPTHKWGAMPWEQDRDETGVYAELVPDETIAEGKTKSAVHTPCALPLDLSFLGQKLACLAMACRVHQSCMLCTHQSINILCVS